MVRKVKSNEELLASISPKNNDGDIDLGIGDQTAPSLATTLYAQRIVTGQTNMPAKVDRELQQAIAIETRKQDMVHNDANGTGSPVSAMLVADHPEVSQQQLEICLREFGFQSLTPEEFIRVGVEEFNQATVKACRAGVAFWAAQEALKAKSARADLAIRAPGMDELIADAGLPKQRVYEAIAMAKFYARLPDTMRSKALFLGKKNALLLASLPQEVIDQAAESGNDLVDKADMMTVRELKEEIRRLERAAKNMDAEIERKDSQVKRLSEAKKRTTDFLLRTEELREECMALQLGAELPLNSLRRLFDDTEISGSEGFLQAETIWIAVNAIASRALDLIQHIRDCGPESLPDRPQAKHLLGPEEAARWLADYPLIENRFEGEKALRESRREAARPRGPGRPKGSGSKAGEE